MAKLVPIVSAIAVFLAGCATHHAAPPPEPVRYVEEPPKVKEQPPAPVEPTPPPPPPAPAPKPKPAPAQPRKSSGGAAALKENQW